MDHSSMRPCVLRTGAARAVSTRAGSHDTGGKPTPMRTSGGELSGVSEQGMTQFREFPFAGTTAGDACWRFLAAGR